MVGVGDIVTFEHEDQMYYGKVASVDELGQLFVQTFAFSITLPPFRVTKHPDEKSARAYSDRFNYGVET
jgi:hypothetical protein